MHSRHAVQTAVGALLARTRSGDGGALLIRTEQGAGGSALLDDAAESFCDGTVLRTCGVAAETAIPYSGLHALLQSVRDRPELDSRDGGRRYPALFEALSLAPARERRREYEHRLTGTAADAAVANRPVVTEPAAAGPVLVEFLALLGELSSEQPLLCCVGEAHLLDPASGRALGFAARRLGRPLPVAMLVSVEADTETGALPPEFEGLPVRTPVPGLAELADGVAELHSGVVSDAREVLLAAARLLTPCAPRAARDALLHAADASFSLGDAAGYLAAADRVTALAPVCGDELVDVYSAGMAALMRGRTAESTALLRRVTGLAVHEERPEHLMHSAAAALVLGEVTLARETGARALAAARAHGPAALVPRVLERLAYGELRTGQHVRARAHATLGLALALRTGQRNSAAHHHAVLAMAAAVEGDAESCAVHARAAGEDAAPHGLGVAGTLAQWSLARCDLGLGRAHDAAARLEPLVHGTPGPGARSAENRPGQGHFSQRMLAVPCFVEAASLAGVPDVARPALDGFTRWTAATSDPLAPAQLARCRALLAPSPEADGLFALALAEHAGSESEYERARTQLLYGKSLRRRRRPRDARGVLRDALFAFERCGARSWADQAQAELRATGESRVAGPGLLDALTPQQLRIAHYVAEGATNREVAVRLSVSPRTVDHHLRNVFAALGIRSRVELARCLTAAPDSAQH